MSVWNSEKSLQLQNPKLQFCLDDILCAKIQTRRLRDLQTLCIISVGKPEITQKSVSALFLCHAHKLMFNKGENVISVLILVPGWPPTRNRNIREYIKPQENTALILPKIHSGIYFTLFQNSPFLSIFFIHTRIVISELQLIKHLLVGMKKSFRQVMFWWLCILH